MLQGEMLKGEHSAILSTFIKLPFVIKIFVLSNFEWPFYTGLALHIYRFPVKKKRFSHLRAAKAQVSLHLIVCQRTLFKGFKSR